MEREFECERALRPKTNLLSLTSAYYVDFLMNPKSYNSSSSSLSYSSIGSSLGFNLSSSVSAARDQDALRSSTFSAFIGLS